MEILKISNFIIIGIYTYIAIIHFILSIKGIDRIYNLTLSIFSIDLGLYLIYITLSLQSLESQAYLSHLNRAFSFGLLAAPILIWFVRYYINYEKLSKICYYVTIASLLFVALHLILPNGIMYIKIIEMKKNILPWGEIIAKADIIGNPWSFIVILIVIPLFFYLFSAVIWQIRFGDKRKSIPITIFIFGLFLQYILNISTRVFNISPTVQFAQYIYLVMIVFASQSTINEISMMALLKKKVKRSEDKFTRAFENSPIATSLLNIKTGRRIEVNNAFCVIYGYSKKEMKDENIFSNKIANEKTLNETIGGIQENGFIKDYPTTVSTKNSGKKNVMLSAYRLYPDNDELYIVSHIDITEQLRSQKKLEQASERYLSFFETVKDGAFITTQDGYFIDCSESLVHLLQYDNKEELFSLKIENFYADQDRSKTIKKELETQGNMVVGERTLRKKDGSIFNAVVSYSVIQDKELKIPRYQGTIKDISEEKMAKESIKKSLTEKEILIRELYHRTNNNMQVISAMLELQILQDDDEHLKEVYSQTKNRINAMALVHAKLYQAEDLSRINIEDYIIDLLEFIISSNEKSRELISIQSSMEDIWLLIDHAMPLGLAINEIINNSFKHAFPESKKGMIQIELSRMNSDEIYLKISDNGVGVKKDFDIDKDSKLGLQSVISLIQYQLKGTVNFDIEEGFTCKIYFHDNTYMERV